MVSTLDILKKEKDLVDEINRVDRYIEIVGSQLEDTKKYKIDCETRTTKKYKIDCETRTTKKYKIDCETRTHDLIVLEDMIKDYQENRSELLKKLDEVQIELRKHLKQMLL